MKLIMGYSAVRPRSNFCVTDYTGGCIEQSL